MAASMPKNWNDFAAVSPQALLWGQNAGSRIPLKKSWEKCQMRFGVGEFLWAFVWKNLWDEVPVFWFGLGWAKQASQCLLRNVPVGLCFDVPTDRKDTATRNLKNRMQFTVATRYISFPKCLKCNSYDFEALICIYIMQNTCNIYLSISYCILQVKPTEPDIFFKQAIKPMVFDRVSWNVWAKALKKVPPRSSVVRWLSNRWMYWSRMESWVMEDWVMVVVLMVWTVSWWWFFFKGSKFSVFWRGLVDSDVWVWKRDSQKIKK